MLIRETLVGIEGRHRRGDRAPPKGVGIAAKKAGQTVEAEQAEVEEPKTSKRQVSSLSLAARAPGLGLALRSPRPCSPSASPKSINPES